MNKNNQLAKAVVVDEIRSLFEQSKSSVLIDYRGLTVEEDTALRSQMRKEGVTYKVLKNTMIKRAADQLNLTEILPFLEGPTAIAFGMTDAITPAKLISECIKKTKKMEFKIGYVEGKCMNAAQLEAVAQLPSKEVLLAKMLGSLNAPITNFVYAINAIKEKKEQETA